MWAIFASRCSFFLWDETYLSHKEKNFLDGIWIPANILHPGADQVQVPQALQKNLKPSLGFGNFIYILPIPPPKFLKLSLIFQNLMYIFHIAFREYFFRSATVHTAKIFYYRENYVMFNWFSPFHNPWEGSRGSEGKMISSCLWECLWRLIFFCSSSNKVNSFVPWGIWVAAPFFIRN